MVEDMLYVKKDETSKNATYKQTNGKTKSSYKWKAVTLLEVNICMTLGLPMSF